MRNSKTAVSKWAPGSHLQGKHPQRAVEGFGALAMDAQAFDMTRLQPLEVEAGDVVFFGAFLVHRSLPNRSGSDRRALLYSFQPGGFPHARNRVKTRAR
jgi:ectoine hydroxylase-related dioxygenase (phytanoyl-CoA dioxygenase family)